MCRKACILTPQDSFTVYTPGILCANENTDVAKGISLHRICLFVWWICPFFNYSHTHTERGNHRHVLEWWCMWWCIPSLTTLPLLARYPLHERLSNNRLSASGFGVSFIFSPFSFCQKRLVNGKEKEHQKRACCVCHWWGIQTPKCFQITTDYLGGGRGGNEFSIQGQIREQLVQVVKRKATSTELSTSPQLSAGMKQCAIHCARCSLCTTQSCNLLDKWQCVPKLLQERRVLFNHC